MHDAAGAATEQVAPPGDAVTVNPVAGPPSPASHDTVTCLFPGVAATMVGAPGTWAKAARGVASIATTNHDIRRPFAPNVFIPG